MRGCDRFGREFTLRFVAAEIFKTALSALYMFLFEFVEAFLSRIKFSCDILLNIWMSVEGQGCKIPTYAMYYCRGETTVEKEMFTGN